MQWVKDLLSSTGNASSARVLNLGGGLVVLLVFIADFIYNGKIDLGAMSIIAAHAAGTYGLSVNKQKGE